MQIYCLLLDDDLIFDNGSVASSVPSVQKVACSNPTIVVM